MTSAKKLEFASDDDEKHGGPALAQDRDPEEIREDEDKSAAELVAEAHRRDAEEPERSAAGAPADGRALRDRFSADEIFQRVVAGADEELRRPARLLFMSGIAAGVAMGAVLIARAGVAAAMGNTELAAVMGNALYPLGFLFIVVGRYQLYTENTLSPVTLVLARLASVPTLLRLWGMVLLANLLGAAAVAFVLARTQVFEPQAAAVALELGLHALEVAWIDLFWKGVFAGALVASMVWMIHATREDVARVLIIFATMFLIPTAGLYHCVAGATEVFYVMFDQTGLNLLDILWHFLAPVVLGNTVGGVVFVSVLNYAQTRESRTGHDERLTLSWRHWLLGGGEELEPYLQE